MISIEELSKVKEKRRTSLFYEEKEYFQYIFLNAISKYSKNFIFKGGTCLRICFGTERASEDLDFNSNLKSEDFKKTVDICLKDFNFLNIYYKVYDIKEFKGNIRFEIRFKGPLFIGKNSSSNTLKLDFNRAEVRNTTVKVVQKLFSDVPLFSLVVMDEGEILAEKIRALINRKEPKDLYDIWMLFNKGVKIDKKFLLIKLKEEKSSLSKLKLPSKEEYEVNLKNLVSILPSYDQVKDEVVYNLNQIISS
jgi:predicted nucleotidyltransferase component of viral defense system